MLGLIAYKCTHIFADMLSFFCRYGCPQNQSSTQLFTLSPWWFHSMNAALILIYHGNFKNRHQGQSRIKARSKNWQDKIVNGPKCWQRWSTIGDKEVEDYIENTSFFSSFPVTFAFLANLCRHQFHTLLVRRGLLIGRAFFPSCMASCPMKIGYQHWNPQPFLDWYVVHGQMHMSPH